MRRLLSPAILAGLLLLSGCGGSGGPTPSPQPTPVLLVRKEATQLTNAEVRAFVKALKRMKEVPSIYEPSVSAYDYFVALHIAAFSKMNSGAHMAPNFLPWHRELLRRFEKEMQRVSGNPTITLPYWDWTNIESTRRVFSDDFLGGKGDPADNDLVESGPFRKGQWAINVSDVDDVEGEFGGKPEHLGKVGLRRELGDVDDPSGYQLPARADVERCLHVETYDVAPFDMMSDPAESFRQFIEAGDRPADVHMHNGVHVWVGGHMNSAGSPNDPAFFLHHANIDRIWAVWQDVHGDDTYPAEFANARLFGMVKTKAKDLFDLRAEGVRYDSIDETTP